jgi:hypothetical protein
MKHMFDSGERVLLAPFTIPVDAPCLSILFYSFFTLSLYVFRIPTNLVFFCSTYMQYLLDMSPFTQFDDNDNPLPRAPFNAKNAARMFPHFVREMKIFLRQNWYLLFLLFFILLMNTVVKDIFFSITFVNCIIH